jgi:PAS domain S-box-containing protein
MTNFSTSRRPADSTNFPRFSFKLGAILLILCRLLSASPAHALQKATVQLKWLHHFQFAGYYAALEKGFYRDAGLDVTIREGGPEVEVERDVVAGKSDFGVGTSALLLNRAKGQDLVVLAQIFQHSPATLLTLKKTGIRSVADMAGRRIMYSNQHGDMLALFRKNGISEDGIVKVPHQGDPHDLISGKADVMIAYSFNEPFIIEQSGEPYLMFSPISSGIDFYGDNLFTTRLLAEARPEFVEAFREATIKGWRYTMSHKAEIADLILAKYSKGKSKDWLMFEANQMETLIQPTLVELGYQNPSRWQHIADTFTSLGMLQPGFDAAAVIYRVKPAKDYRLVTVVSLVSFAIILVLAWLVATFRSLNLRLAAANSALAHKENNLRVIFDVSRSGILMVDGKGCITLANERVAEMFGCTLPELIGTRYPEHVHPDQREASETRMRMHIEARLTNIYNARHYLRKDGTDFWGVVSSGRHETADGSLISLIMLITDITEQKLADLALQESERRYSSMFETMQEGFALHEVILDESGKPVDYRFLDVNPAFERLTGLKKADVVGRSVREVMPGLEETWITTYGEVALTGLPAELEQYASDLGRYFRARCYSPERNRFVVIFEDTTAQKKAEDEHRLIERQLLHTQKLESLGVLAGGIAHDFNNILTSIIGNAELARIRMKPESPALENLQRIELAASRAADLSKQMLAYSGKGKFVVEPIDLNRLVEEMGHMLEVSISKKATLRYNLAPDLPPVDADATQLNQIIMNLVINASEAIGDASGVIAISTGSIECNEAYFKDAWLTDAIPEGMYNYLEVADTGCGMEKGTLAKIFDPFYTTKFTGRGLGMAAVIGIIRGHRGAIKVYSEPGKGSSFKVLLPPGGGQVKPFTDDAPADSWKGSGVALLVDDEETILDVGEELLRELGYEVVSALDGQEALEKFSSRGDIDVVILDLTMPRMDGEQCFQRLRQLSPDVPVIMSSGYNEQEVRLKFAGKGLAGFIQKPYNLTSLRGGLKNLRRGEAPLA